MKFMVVLQRLNFSDFSPFFPPRPDVMEPRALTSGSTPGLRHCDEGKDVHLFSSMNFLAIPSGKKMVAHVKI